MEILILCKKLEISEKSSFCPLPKRWYSLSFIGCFSSSTVLFQVAPPFYQKYAEFHYFLAFWVPKGDFWPRIGLLGARLRTLYKHKLLGGFLEAPSRKNAFRTRKVGNFAPKPDFREKSVFRAKSLHLAKIRKCSRNLTISALKSCSEIPILLFLEPFCLKRLNLVKFTNFLEIPRNLVKFREICGIWAILRKRAIRAEMTKNTCKIAL